MTAIFPALALWIAAGGNAAAQKAERSSVCLQSVLVNGARRVASMSPQQSMIVDGPQMTLPYLGVQRWRTNRA
jgi:hypothetical protein